MKKNDENISNIMKILAIMKKNDEYISQHEKNY